MKKSLYSAALVCLILLGACAEKETQTLPVALETVSTQLEASAVVTPRTITAADPTLTPAADRYGEGHFLTITIGSSTAQYKYDTGSSAWVPNVSTAPAVFPGFANSAVNFLLNNPSVSDAVAAQDGTSQKLLHADILTATLTSQVPTKNLSGVTLTHSNALFDITLSSSLDLSKVNSVGIGDATAYPVPVTSGDPDNFLLILAPGAHSTAVTIDYNGVEYLCTVEAGILTTDLFAKNKRYKFELSLEAGELVASPAVIAPWTESQTGWGTVN